MLLITKRGSFEVLRALRDIDCGRLLLQFSSHFFQFLTPWIFKTYNTYTTYRVGNLSPANIHKLISESGIFKEAR